MYSYNNADNYLAVSLDYSGISDPAHTPPSMAASSTLMTDEDAPEVVAATFKVLVLGNSDVGKTSLIRLYSRGEVAQNLLPTVG